MTRLGAHICCQFEYDFARLFSGDGNEEKTFVTHNLVTTVITSEIKLDPNESTEQSEYEVYDGDVL